MLEAFCIAVSRAWAEEQKAPAHGRGEGERKVLEEIIFLRKILSKEGNVGARDPPQQILTSGIRVRLLKEEAVGIPVCVCKNLLSKGLSKIAEECQTAGTGMVAQFVGTFCVRGPTIWF